MARMIVTFNARRNRASRRQLRRARWLVALATAVSLAPLVGMGMGSPPREAAQAQTQAQLSAVEGTPAAAGAAGAPRSAPLDRNALLMIVRSALLALNHANETGNYTVLRDLGTPSFQAANTAARLAEIFASLRNGRVDLTSVAVLEPQITQGPQIEKDNLIRLAGFFSAGGLQLNFEIAVQPVEGRLRLFGITTNLIQSPAASGGGSPDAARGPAALPAASAPAAVKNPAAQPQPANPMPKP